MGTVAKRKSNVLTPKRIRDIREKLGLTIEQAAERIGVMPRTWRAWEQPSQGRSPSESHAILIRLLQDGTI